MNVGTTRFLAVLFCCVMYVAAAAESEIKPAALGADTRAPTAEEAKTYGLDALVGRVRGQYVTALDKEGPAAKAGLKAGDVILSLDDNKLYSRDDLEDVMRVTKPGASVKVAVKRAGTFKEEALTVTLGTALAASKDAFTWQYAGPGQLNQTRARARKEGKLILVGLSGADT